MSDISIPGFEIVEKVGQGGMASVWKARQVSLDRIVAIKVLAARLAGDEEDVARFQAEARAAAKLKHPGIVQVHDANAVAGMYYFVMEYVAGYTAGDWVRRKGVLKEKDALLVAECVADALGYAWKSAGIIHCDIKPDNVMVDADGTVKVADLGLARTISAMSAEDEADEVMGTPAYVSPEQAAGEAGLDCRTDIYALGATLYHLLTGKMLFEGQPEEKVMSLQITDTVPHPYDLNPKLSRGMCRLIEKMLAKSKDDRESNWDAVRTDIARVRKGLVPKALAEGAESTVAKPTAQHTDWHHVEKRARDIQRARGKKEPPISAPAMLTIVFLLVLGAALIFSARRMGSKEPPPPTPSTPAKPPDVARPVEDPPARPVSPQKTAEQRAAEAFAQAADWAGRNPGRFDAAIGRFEQVARSAAGTTFAGKARQEIGRLADAKQASIDRVMAGLDEQAAPHLESGAYLAAAEVYDTYGGVMEMETREKRLDKAHELRRRHEAAAERERTRKLAEAKMTETTRQAANALLANGVSAAHDIVYEALADPLLASRRDELAADMKLLVAAGRIDDRILGTFRDQQGSAVTVYLAAGPVSGTIVEVVGTAVTMEVRLGVGNARTSKTFKVSDLASREVLARMGPDADPGVALMKGVMAMEARAYTHAARYFGELDSPLGRRLLVLAEDDGEPADEPDDDVPGEDVRVDVPDRRPVERPVVRLPAHLEAIRGDAKAVIAMLIEENPGLQREHVREVRDSAERVVELRIHSGLVTDIGPVAALTDLRTFTYVPHDPETGRYVHHNPSFGRLKDISPLKDLSLERCTIVNCPLSDVGALRRLPLRALNLSGTAVRDIAALRDMPLEHVNLSGTKVVSLSALRGMPLTSLDLSRTDLRDLAWLRDLPLAVLSIAGTNVSDLGPLRHLKLRTLDVSGTPVRDLSDLVDVPLRELTLVNTGVMDLSPLREMELETLDLGGVKTSDFSPLRGLEIRNLRLDRTSFEDIGMLNGMPLEHLNLRGTRVSDIWAVQGMPLVSLDIYQTAVSNLAPLKGSPLKTLVCQRTKVRDFSPLAGSLIESLYIDEPLRHAGLVRRMPNLRRLNGVPVGVALAR